MKSPFRIISRVIFLLVVLVLLGIGAVLAVFTSWRSDKMAELNAESEIAQTAVGPVEFVNRGDGPAVLVFHGTPGGYDQAQLLGSGLSAAGFQVIAPSRPGYLRTPLGSGVLPEEQADAMAALLDTLGLQSVAVLGVSGGGPAALQFVVRHPERTRALVLLSAVTKEGQYVPNKKSLLGEKVHERLTGDIGSWIAVEMAERDPRSLLEETLALTSTADEAARSKVVSTILSSPDQVEWFRGLVGTLAPMSPRETGLRNDLLQFRKLPKVKYEDVAVPTLVIHGTADSDVPFADAQELEARLPSGTLLPLEGVGHLVELGPQADEVQKRMADFLRLDTEPLPQP